MIDETLRKIEERVAGLDTLGDPKKRELAGLFQTLRAEMASLEARKSGQAETIARFADLSTHEAMREDGNPKLRSISLEGLAASVEGFEAEHPKLVEIVNSICVALSGLGI